jgi:predicted dehydrogenase
VKVALDAVQESLHVFVEKPIDIKVSRALDLLRAAKSKRVRLAVSSQKRFTKGSLQIREWVKSGKLGKIFLSRAIVPWYRSQHYYDMGGWRGTFKMDGGGALINQSIHMLDLLLHLTGKKVMAVSAASGTFTHKIEAEDTLVGHLRMKDGTVGQILAATSIYPGFADRVELYGEKGCAIWESDKVIFSLFKAKKVPDYGLWLTSDKLKYSKQPSGTFDALFLAQLKPAAAFFRTGKGNIVTGESATQTLAVIEAIYKSTRSHKEERVQQI